LVAAALCLVSVGCAADEELSTTTAAAGAVTPFPQTIDALDAVLDTFAATDLTLERQIQEGIATCMADQGFLYQPWVRKPTEPSTTPIVDSVENMLLRSGEVDPNYVYSADLELSDPGKAARWQIALHGEAGAPSVEALASGEEVVTDGCENTEALKVVGAEQRRRVAVILLASAELYDAAAVDASVVAARKGFDDCTNESVVLSIRAQFETAFATLENWDQGSSLELTTALAVARELELQLARATSACREQTGLDDATNNARSIEFSSIAARWFTE
jgi:hypothetical protein